MRNISPRTDRFRETEDKGESMKTSEMVAIIHRGIFREKEAIRAYV